MSRLLLGLILGVLLAGGAVTARPASPAFWVPAWSEVSRLTWTRDGRAMQRPGVNPQVWSVWYAKQPQHTGVKLCGLVTGAGEVLLAYGSAGDAVLVHGAQPTFTCVQTIVGPGGGSANVAVEVYLRATDGQTLTWAEPTLLLQVTP